jgi:hypothetical protein
MLDAQQLSFSSLLGNVAVVLTMGVVIWNSLLFMYSAERPPDAEDSKVFAAIHSNYVAAVPNIFFSFVMHGTILSQYQSMQPSKRCEAPKQLNRAALAVSVSYALFAVVAYVAYYSDLSAEGYKTGTSILLILRPQTRLVRATATLLSCAIFFSIPLFMHGIFDAFGLGLRGDSEGVPNAASGRTRATACGALRVLRVLVLLPMAGVLSIVRTVESSAAAHDTGQTNALQYPLKVTGAVAMSWHTFSKVLSMVPLYSKCTGALTFQNFCKAGVYYPGALLSPICPPRRGHLQGTVRRRRPRDGGRGHRRLCVHFWRNTVVS